MICEKCQGIVSVKADENKISLLCKCEIQLIYPNKKITTISKNEYLEHKQKKEY